MLTFSISHLHHEFVMHHDPKNHNKLIKLDL
jgi:hypothetical protein